MTIGFSHMDVTGDFDEQFWWSVGGHHLIGGSIKENERRGFGKVALDNSYKEFYCVGEQRNRVVIRGKIE